MVGLKSTTLKNQSFNLIINLSNRYRYGETKLANIQFTTHLSKLLLAKGHDKVYVNCCHPGVVNTNLSHNSVYIPKFLTGVIGMFLTTVEKGAKTQMYLAADMEVEEKNLNGLYYIPTAKLGVTTSYGKEDLPAKNLWDWTCKIVKEKLGDKVTIFE